MQTARSVQWRNDRWRNAQVAEPATHSPAHRSTRPYSLASAGDRTGKPAYDSDYESEFTFVMLNKVNTEGSSAILTGTSKKQQLFSKEIRRNAGKVSNHRLEREFTWVKISYKSCVLCHWHSHFSEIISSVNFCSPKTRTTGLVNICLSAQMGQLAGVVTGRSRLCILN